MTTVHAHRAQPARPDQQVPQVTVVVDLDLPDRDTLAEAQALFDADAKAIADALHASLPGGTLRALLVEFLRHDQCLLRVPTLTTEVAR